MSDAAVAEKPEEVKERKVDALDPTRMKGAEYERAVYVVTAGEGVGPSDVLKPEYWAHVASKLKPWDRIELRANDETWYMELLVLDVKVMYVKVKLLAAYDLTEAVNSEFEAVQAEYTAEWSGPHTKWRVRRTKDKEIVQESIGSKDEALRWIKERLKAN